MLRKILPHMGVVNFNCCGAGKGWMRIRLKKEEGQLHVWVWPEPWCFEKTEDALKRDALFPFDEEGFCACDAWLDGQYAQFPPGNPPLGAEPPEAWKAAFRAPQPAPPQTDVPWEE